MTRLAKTVVFNADEYIFDVDGKPFPWYLPENELPRARKIDDGFYEIDVTFMAVVKDHPQTPCSFEQTEWEQPFICGIEFPWWIHADGVTFTAKHGEILLVALTFFTESVEGMEVADEVIDPTLGRVRDIGGMVVHKVGA